ILGDFVRRERSYPYDHMRAFSSEFIEQFQQAGLLRTDLTPDMVIYLLTTIRYGLLTVDEILPNTWVPSLDDVGAVLPDILERAFAPPGGGNREAGKQALARFVEQTREMLKVMRETPK
ncbi:MAG TPA: hypothetical protein VHL11_16160, partial [Phototrophicaceae bacterium]|nr:hypothetical protein [Phototrophicaceae bacterium]